MSTQKDPETAASTSSSDCLAESRPEQSVTDQEINEEYTRVLKNQLQIATEYYNSFGGALGEMMRYIPRYLQKENYEQEFDPKFILFCIATQSPNKSDMNRNIGMLVMLGIEKGNNLDKIAVKLSPYYQCLFLRLKRMYNLVPKANNSKRAVTLSRICESVPILTCLYLKNKAKNPVVPFELMESICKNYPRVMMTSAFAYLIPNKEDEFCQFLKKAHLLHRYQFFATISRQSHPCSSVDDEDKFISKVYVGTQAAINRSHIKYDIQMKFLIENDLILEVENKITATEGVLEAAKLWDKKIRQHEINQRYDGYEYGEDFM
ncbi:nucleoprotein [Aphis craccivora]|uniref:Nucleoprotein n=1 Tax=Aphis craccivora TaxID=307492 RepID=A0A6G0YGS6_APHCR|nr:nucleoprotein [Aphis craccivora]